HLFEDGRKYRFDFPNGLEISHVLPVGDSAYYLTAVDGGGLLYAELDYAQQSITIDTFLQGKSLSMVTQDSKGGLWITSLDDGVFYCPYPAQRIIKAPFEGLSPRPTSMSLVNATDFFAAYANSSVWLHQTVLEASNRLKVKKELLGGVMDDIIYYPPKDRLYLHDGYISNAYNDYTKVKTKTLYCRDLETLMPYSSIKEFNLIRGELFWSGISNFGRVDFEQDCKALSFEFHINTRDRHGYESYYVFPDGKAILGTLYGLKAVVGDDNLVAYDFGIDALKGRIERIVELKDGKVAVGTRDNGLVIIGEQGAKRIDEQDKLASNQIRNLHVTDDGTLWVASLQGISKITASSDSSYDVRTFDIGNALLDNEVHDFDSWNNQLWIVSTAGIYRFVEPPLDTVSYQPKLKSITVNSKPYPLKDGDALKPQQNYLSFGYSNVIFSQGANVTYRYRMNGGTWQETKERRANYPNLPAGDYVFEVQAQNRDGVWSASSSRSFTINAYFLYTWKAWALGVLLLLGLVSGIFLVRERNRRREQKFLLEISELEHAALHAQMNPHFVFNCLNSIQNFVLHNHTREAATYLSRFAKLIRKTLNSSLHGQHSLQEEKEMLNGYLELEKLRFKDVFDYEVSLAQDLPASSIFVPPLLIQPFVENAILHGMEDRMEGGLIKIDIGGTAKKLLVTITDNGIGYDPNKPVKASSKGMLITRRRFQANAGSKHGKDEFNIQPIRATDGTVVGTRVTLSIKPVTEAKEAAKIV
ncbi:MAG: histidine kinase, partial [Bacteroidota bacterium]